MIVSIGCAYLLIGLGVVMDAVVRSHKSFFEVDEESVKEFGPKLAAVEPYIVSVCTMFIWPYFLYRTYEEAK